MAQNSKIEWTDHTANLWHGCTEVHAGCDNCYARVLSNRWKRDLWGNDVPRMEIKSCFPDLLKYQKQAKELGVIQKVFVGSMMDIFEKPKSLINSKGESLVIDTGWLRNKFFNEVVPVSPNLIFLLLTKRPSNINKYIPDSWKSDPPKNVMFGTSPVDQKTAETLIPQLLKVNGKKFLSVEPQLGPIDLTDINIDSCSCNILSGFCDPVPILRTKINWVIQGGESGHHKRPFDLAWAYDLKKQCEEAGVPYFFKQIDKIKEIPADLQIRQFPKL